MPKTTRDWAVRKIEMADGNLSWAMTHLTEVVDTYHKEHPEIAGPLLLIIETILTIQRAIVRQRNMI